MTGGRSVLRSGSSNGDRNTIVECKCNQAGKAAIFEIAALGNPNELLKYLETGWLHFLQQQEDVASEPPPSLLDAEHSLYWSKRKDVFCNQTHCIYSPNYATWHPLPDSYSALIAAIRAQSPGNVELLLKLGANSDGYQISAFETWQALFLRFRTKIDLNNLWDDYSRAQILADIPRQQTVHITETEVGSRLLLEFWKGEAPSYLYDDYPNFGHPLVIAAGSGLLPIMDQLLATDADCLFWVAFPALLDIPEPPTPSWLQPECPSAGDIWNICTSITPLMATFIQCETWNETAYEALANDPRIDFTIRTPYLLVHILHVATAHSLQALQRVERSVPLEYAGATAAGHTLLHIAYMSSMIQHHASKTRESIYNLRCKHKGPSSVHLCELEFPAQMDLLRYLLSKGFEPYLAFQDSDLNTPMHYLAGARVINKDAIVLLRGLSDGESERIWREVKNWYGYTAEEIWEQNRRVRTQKDSWYGGTTHKVAKMPGLRI
ncbi:hypothetical protein N7466_004404 [Penicillium verhagenii]|uniref:uncharacterized protein n=1 Tax=Penicillium verhagenii TaxID=1562060 RepID=UPI002544F23C|nr:uncharacterized protein N7466_004404 [Penicillium verhagenii]KAJ5934857.1 hypothetical protein N7466_004404 [Penicillium verhagenii]